MLHEYGQFFARVARSGLVATPDYDDWLRAGMLIARYSWRYGAIDTAKHLNDLLILLTARKLGAELITENLRDMQSWGRMLDPKRPVSIRPSSDFGP